MTSQEHSRYRGYKIRPSTSVVELVRRHLSYSR